MKTFVVFARVGLPKRVGKGWFSSLFVLYVTRASGIFTCWFLEEVNNPLHISLDVSIFFCTIYLK